MGKCTHQHKKIFSWFPKSLIHNHDDHDCDCVKCYLNNIVSTSKTAFVWIIDYILLFTIFNSESNQLEDYILCSSTKPRSPPKYI
jgi:hypothetical protein